MTAYKLADELAECIIDGSTDLVCVAQAANMLRQQADRIAELEKKLQESAMNYISICSQADEHYARVQELEKELKRTKFAWNLAENEIERLTPQTKPLSDEEIWNWFKENTALTKESALRIAKAIEERAWD